MKSVLLPLAAMAVLLMASCSGQRAERQLLDAIPADATSVSFFDLGRLASEGVDIEAAARTSLPVHTGLRAFVTLADGTSIQLSPFPPVDSLAAAGYILEGTADEPLTTYYNADDGTTAVLDTRREVAYYTVFSPARALEIVSDIAASADRHSFGVNRGLADFFDRQAGQAAVYGAISGTLFGGAKASADDPQSGQWIAYDVRQEDGTASVDARMMLGDGAPVKPRGLQELATDFLRYIPAEMNLVAAVGLTPEIDWDAAARLVALAADRETASIFAIASPYLKAIDGTVAVATAIDTTANYSSFFVMARMDREKIKDLMSQIGTLTAMAGGNATTLSDSQVKISAPTLPFTIYAGEVDGNFAVASFPLDGRAENSFATSFEGHDAAAVFTLPTAALASGLIPGAEAIDARLSIDGAEAGLKLTFPGAKESPLALIVRRLAY